MKEYQGDIFGNWKPVEQVFREIKCDKRFFSKLHNYRKKNFNNKKKRYF